MTKFTKYLTLLFLTTQITSCSLGFLASKKQTVNLKKDSLTTVLIDDTIPALKNGLYTFNRDGSPVQLTIKKEGFKDEYQVLMPTRKSGLYYGTYALNIGAYTGASLFLGIGTGPISTILVGSFAGWYGAHSSPRLWEFPKTICLSSPTQTILKRDTTMKELFLNKVSFDVSGQNIKWMTVNYTDKYKAGILPNNWSTNSKKKSIKIDNSIFSDEINQILRKNGFIDTSGMVLRKSYNDNLYINATITEVKLLTVKHKSLKSNFSKLFLNTKWEILDIYKNNIYNDTLQLASGEFIISDNDDENITKAIRDALEFGLNKLMNTSKFKNVITITESKTLEMLNDIEIPNPVKQVSSLEDAVSATVTIKTKAGHGSGFLISENGYLITNYHVVADTSKLEVILNDGSRLKATLIQFNKDADIAILKINKNGLTPFKLPDAEAVSIGKEIFAIGTPSAEDLSQTLSKGIISSIRKQNDGSKLIQTDASVNSGSSGGPLVDKSGNLLGVVNAKLVGIGVEGISFAIPVSTVIPSLKLSYK